MPKTLFLVLVALLFSKAYAQKQMTYKVPHEDIVKLVDAPKTPSVILDPQKEWLLQLEPRSLPSINRVAQKEIRVAGIRINPNNYSRSRANYYKNLKLTRVDNGKDYIVEGLPDNPLLNNFSWSPNGAYVAFNHCAAEGLELWILDVGKKKAKRLGTNYVNGTLSNEPIKWLDEGSELLFSAVSDRIEKPSQPTQIPTGPLVRSSKGKKAAVRTYQDLIKTPYDASVFEYYTSSVLMRIDLKGDAFEIGIPGIFYSFSLSPSREYLLVKMIQKPYSYVVPYYRFARKVEIWDTEGILYRELFNIARAENIPKGFGAVKKGPRAINWRSDVPATLFWVEAQDEGDPNLKAVIRDRLFMYKYPFEGEAKSSIGFKYRFGEVVWGKNDFALASQWWWNTRQEEVFRFNPAKPKSKKELLFAYNWQDEYNHPGQFVIHKNSYGKEVLLFNENQTAVYLRSRGASPDGYKPYIARYKLSDGAKDSLWQSAAPYYEYPLAFISEKKLEILTRRESKTDPPNYFVRNMENGVVSQISNYSNPYPQMEKVRSKLVRYNRADGLPLSGKLYLPPNFELGNELLPVLIWAYPNEYKDAKSAGQIKESPYRFVRINQHSPLFWTMRGYAVFDNPGMPIIGEKSAEPNDTFVEQLVLNAEAAVRCLDSMGIADKNRIAIGGHSYGAFMTANLLSHTNLFAAGIARSGAYNRSLTPFGFQAEERTFWEATNTYIEMSPFSYAHKMKTPLLLIHGSADNNSGTYPMQSERYFAALKGNGAVSRLVMLPDESHGYRARESVLHMLWEMDNWLNRYLKNKK